MLRLNFYWSLFKPDQLLKRLILKMHNLNHTRISSRWKIAIYYLHLILQFDYFKQIKIFEAYNLGFIRQKNLLLSKPLWIKG